MPTGTKLKTFAIAILQAEIALSADIRGQISGTGLRNCMDEISTSEFTRRAGNPLGSYAQVTSSRTV